MKEQFIEVEAIEKFFESLARFSQRLEPIVAMKPHQELGLDLFSVMF